MKMTEQQASEKWCPMVRSAGDGIAGDNTYVRSNGVTERNPHYARCIGSQCAMWEWEERHGARRASWTKNNDAQTPEESGTEQPAPGWIFYPCEDEPACWIEPESEWLARRIGHCGLSRMTG